jgi:flavin reductase (DIM6/NTAB) family NADH-FMN oxidoreductase RutF
MFIRDSPTTLAHRRKHAPRAGTGRGLGYARGEGAAQATLLPALVPVDRDTFVEIMASYPAGVAIVTTLDTDGTPRGLTTTAVSSVSAEPPLLLVCVDLTSRTLPALRKGGRFVVNFLREGRSELARLFASKRDDKFEQVRWEATASGMPFLSDDALAWAECVTVQELEPGDHVILLGQVEEGAGAADEDAPLMYYRRSWGVWKPAPRQIGRREIPALEVSGQDLLWEGAEL